MKTRFPIRFTIAIQDHRRRRHSVQYILQHKIPEQKLMNVGGEAEGEKLNFDEPLFEHDNEAYKR